MTALDYNAHDARACTLYTSMEPCPLCLGAIYMSGVRSIAYAARDPYAGSTNLLGTTPYLQVKTIRVDRGPSELETISTGLMVANMLEREGGRVAPRAVAALAYWRPVLPQGTALAELLYQRGELQRLAREQATAATVFDRLAELAGLLAV